MRDMGVRGMLGWMMFGSQISSRVCPQGLREARRRRGCRILTGNRTAVQTAKIVEGQEAARFDGYPRVLSIDFRRKLRQSIAVGRII
jgi:hypothetical protein